MSDNRYMMRGVSAAKEDVHNAIKNIDKGIFPQAPSHHWLICTGKKQAISQSGKVLPRMPSS